ncbi:MAG: hypothetical protein AAB225_11835, partial [Acidobacteriota bacterium]
MSHNVIVWARLVAGFAFVVALACALAPPAAAQGQQNFPDFVVVEPAFIQATFPSESPVGASKTNNVALLLRAQMVRKISLDPPFRTVPLTLNPLTSTSGFELLRIAGPAFSQACSLLLVGTPPNTVVECRLTPSPGPTWGTAGPL